MISRVCILFICLLTSQIKLNAQDVEIPSTASYKYETPKEHFISFHSNAFNSVNPDSYNLGNSVSNKAYSYFIPSSSFFGYAECQLNLPDGATVTELKAWVYDNDATELIRVRLHSFDHALADAEDFINSPIINLETTTESTDVQELSGTGSAVIDNENKRYYINFQSSGRNSNLRLYSVRVKYEVDGTQ